jgi:hypothetical protein
MSDTLQLVVVTLAAVIALAAIVRPYLPGRGRRSTGGVALPTPTCAKCAASHARPVSIAASTPAPRATPARSHAAPSRSA